MGINVMVSKQIRSKFNDLYLQLYLTKFFSFAVLMFSCEPTTVLNVIEIGVGDVLSD